MRIAIFANTPAQIHFFKNIARILESRSHQIEFLIRDYRESVMVADLLGIKYSIYSYGQSHKIIGSIGGFPNRILKSLKILRIFKPDIILGTGLYDTYVSLILGKPCIEFADSEPLINPIFLAEIKMYMPFVDAIITPKLFNYDIGKNHIRVDSYKELAYLHRKYYAPNDDIFQYIGIEKGESYIILRFNAFDAVHDAKISGFSLEQKIRLLKELMRYSKVFISCEGTVPKDLEQYLLRIPKHRIHDAIFFSNLLIADTQTMITEAGILGTPAIRCNSFVGENDMSNFKELEEKYGLIFNFKDPEKAIAKAIDLIQQPNLKIQWDKKRQKLLEEKIDITGFMIWFIENYPHSHHIMMTNPAYQSNFI